jgi:outer membrane protein assembly factor BamA
MKDQFIPQMRYTYIYSSPFDYLNPIFWQTTVSEAANLLSLGYMIGGEKWKDKDKTMFKNPYAQFFKFETELRKTWHLSSHTQLVSHLDFGIIWSYGNSSAAPYTEQFYVGGANSIRAFTVRSIGPGSYEPPSKSSSYLDQTGDIKFLANLEYRSRLFGNLYGAIFLDAGNVWSTGDYTLNPDDLGDLDDDDREVINIWNREVSDLSFKPGKLLKHLATGTGLGLRYDMDFLVIRVDWGFGLHVPYTTDKSGYFNIPRFKDMHSLHLAIGYPF